MLVKPSNFTGDLFLYNILGEDPSPDVTNNMSIYTEIDFSLCSSKLHHRIGCGKVNFPQAKTGRPQHRPTPSLDGHLGASSPHAPASPAVGRQPPAPAPPRSPHHPVQPTSGITHSTVGAPSGGSGTFPPQTSESGRPSSAQLPEITERFRSPPPTRRFPNHLGQPRNPEASRHLPKDLGNRRGGGDPRHPSERRMTPKGIATPFADGAGLIPTTQGGNGLVTI